MILLESTIGKLEIGSATRYHCVKTMTLAAGCRHAIPQVKRFVVPICYLYASGTIQVLAFDGGP
jgi:hypothetical protein